ncbi:MAG TPA: hypothetical protein VFP87_03140 [Chitinophagaceae bacterium]|nr:hypothetical protein [Chitinophagaceae bacterium]
MKKIITILALVLTVSTSFAYTTPETVSSQALNSFNSEFVGASDAAWTITKNFYKVSFTLNEQKLIAYFNKSGEFMAVSRNISSVQLPVSLKKGLKKHMSDYWISDLFEISNPDQTSWYVTLESADQKVVLKSDNGGKWRIFQASEK